MSVSGNRRCSRAVAGLLLLLAPAAASAALERRIEVAAGERLRVFDEGHGEPVVLIPGPMGSAFGFRKLIGPLVERGHRVIAIEPLGVGGSATPQGADYSLTAQAERLERAFTMLAVDEPVVVAHAASASIALRLAYRHPRRVRAVVLLDGAAAESTASPAFRRAMRFSFLVRLFGLSRLRRKVRETLIETSVDASWVTDEVVQGYLAAEARDLGETLRALRKMAEAREPELIAPHLSRVRCPVRLVIGVGNRSLGVGEADVAVLAQGLGSFSIDRVANAGFFVFEEEPQAVIAAVERALASVRLGGDVSAGHGAR